VSERDRSKNFDAPTMLRLRLLDEKHAAVAEFDAKEVQASRELEVLTRRAGSTLGAWCLSRT
jgi:hypothetical protein